MLGDNESSIVANRMRIRAAEFAEFDHRFNTTIDASFLLDSMLERVESQVNERAAEVARCHPEMIAAFNWFALSEGSVRDLLNLYLKGNYVTRLKQAAKKSQFLELCRLFARLDLLESFSVERVDIESEEGA